MQPGQCFYFLQRNRVRRIALEDFFKFSQGPGIVIFIHQSQPKIQMCLDRVRRQPDHRAKLRLAFGQPARAQQFQSEQKMRRHQARRQPRRLGKLLPGLGAIFQRGVTLAERKMQQRIGRAGLDGGAVVGDRRVKPATLLTKFCERRQGRAATDGMGQRLVKTSLRLVFLSVCFEQQPQREPAQTKHRLERHRCR